MGYAKMNDNILTDWCEDALAVWNASHSAGRATSASMAEMGRAIVIVEKITATRVNTLRDLKAKAAVYKAFEREVLAISLADDILAME